MQSIHSLLRRWPVWSLTSLFAVSTWAATQPLGERVTTLLAQQAPATAETERAERMARDALERAKRAAASEQAALRESADVLVETAHEWAQLRAELSELDKLEKRSVEAQARLQELDSQLKREQAHLEETEARRGRALAELEKLAPTSPSSTATPETELQP